MNYTLENFIDYCDDMMITNEGKLGVLGEKITGVMEPHSNSYDQKMSGRVIKGVKNIDNFDWIVIDRTNFNDKTYIKSINKRYSTANIKANDFMIRDMDYVYVWIFDPFENRTVAKAEINREPDFSNAKTFPKNDPVMLVDFKIFPKYQRYRLSVPLLKELVRRFNINCVGVSTDAELANHVFKQVGFKTVDDNYSNYLHFNRRENLMFI